jgi:hypothetical protein
MLDASSARLKIKGGTTGTNSGIDWTFNSDTTVYAKMELNYNDRATTGLLIDSGYPMTLDYSSSRFAIRYNGTEQMRIDSSGNLGLGTTLPTNGGGNGSWLSLNAVTSSPYSGGIAYTIANVVKAYHYVESGYLRHQAQSDVGHRFTVNGTTDAMYITSGGNVGIGTGASVDANLHVVGTDIKLQGVGIAGDLTFAYNAGNNSTTIADVNYANINATVTSGSTGSESGKLSFQTRNAGTVADRMTIDSSGKVGIGNSSPAEKLQVAGSIKSTSRAISGSSTAGVTLSYDTANSIAKIETWTSKPFSIETAGVERMRIESDGDVGIGSTAPTSTLTVGSTTDNQTFSLGQRASGNQSGRTVLIEGIANSTNGEGSGRIFFTEHNSTSASANLYGIALTYSGDNTPQFPSGATPGLGNAKWALMRHHNSLNGASVIYGSRTDSDVYFANNIYMPNALLHVNDTNTYIQFHAADQFRVVTGGNERFEVNNTQITANIGEFIATGDVGIGTTSPNTKLHVSSDAGFPQVRFQEQGVAEAVGLRFQAQNSAQAQVYADIKFDPDSAELIINNPYNSGTQSLTVDSSSNVFIGNDLYVPDQIIHTGDTNTYMQFNGADSWRVVIGGTETIEANSTRTKISSGTSEILRLSTTSATGNPYISFYQSTTRRSFIQHQDSGDMLKLASEYGGIEFFTGTGGTETEKMVIQSDGDVGIGVTNPVNKLQVGGKIYSSGDIQAAGQLQGTDLKLAASSSSQGDLSTASGFIDIEVDGSNYIIPYFDPE